MSKIALNRFILRSAGFLTYIVVGVVVFQYVHLLCLRASFLCYKEAHRSKLLVVCHLQSIAPRESLGLAEKEYLFKYAINDGLCLLCLSIVYLSQHLYGEILHCIVVLACLYVIE